MKWQFSLDYLNDIIIFSESLSEHVKHVCQVLYLLSDAAALLKLKKCSFFSDTIDYLGHPIHLAKLEIAGITLEAICDLKGKCNVTELRSFLVQYNAFHRSIPNFVRISYPFNKKLCKNQPKLFEDLTDDERDALKILQGRLIYPPFPVLPRAKGRYIINTDACDACDRQIGAMLFQEQPDRPLKPIGY